MNSELNICDIIEDLLPFYLDHTIEPEAETFVKEHLETCPACKNLYDMMKTDFQEASPASEEKLPDFRKKYRKRLILFCVLAFFLLILILFVLLLLIL